MLRLLKIKETKALKETKLDNEISNEHISLDNFDLKPSAHSRFLSLRRFLFFPNAAHSRLLSLPKTISEAFLRETFIWGCVGAIFQVSSVLSYWLSKSRGPRLLSRNTAHSKFLSLVSCDQKQISNMLGLRTQSPAIKIVSLKLPHIADFLD